MNPLKKIYWANALFSEADRDFNTKCVTILRQDGYQVFLPQEIIENNPKEIKSPSSRSIFNKDTSAIIDSDLIIACIDQESIDSGVACEIGIACMTGIPILALYTDFRQYRIGDGRMYKNPYILGAIESNGKVFSDFETLRKEIKIYLNKEELPDLVSHFSDIAKNYSEFIINLDKKYTQPFFIPGIVDKHIRETRPTTVMEFGCGDGKLLEKLGNDYNRIKFIGFDSTAMINQSKQKINFSRNVELYDNFETIKENYGHRKIDLIMLIFSLHDNNNQFDILEKMTSLLRPNSKLLFLELMQGDLPNLTESLRKGLSLPMKSFDSRLNVGSINYFSKILQFKIELINLHIPEIIFNSADELFAYIQFFGIDKGLIFH